MVRLEVYAIMWETDDGESEYVSEDAFSTFDGAEIYLESKGFIPDVAYGYVNESCDTFARIIKLFMKTAIETKNGIVFIESRE